MSSPALAWVEGWSLEEPRDLQEDDLVCREALHWVIAGVKPDRANISKFSSELKMLWDILELLNIRDSLLYRQWHLPSTYPETVTQQYVPLVMCQLAMQYLL